MRDRRLVVTDNQVRIRTVAVPHRGRVTQRQRIDRTSRGGLSRPRAACSRLDRRRARPLAPTQTVDANASTLTIPSTTKGRTITTTISVAVKHSAHGLDPEVLGQLPSNRGSIVVVPNGSTAQVLVGAVHSLTPHRYTMVMVATPGGGSITLTLPKSSVSPNPERWTTSPVASLRQVDATSVLFHSLIVRDAEWMNLYTVGTGTRFADVGSV